MIKVVWTKKAHKQAHKLPPREAAQVVCKANELFDWPNVDGVKKIVDRSNEYRLRSGRYRIFFSAHPDGLVTVLQIEEVVIRNERTY